MNNYVYTDLDLTFKQSNDGDIASFKESGAIKSSLLNILSTMQGSRRYLPEFALPIYNLLFEPLDEITAKKIGEEILTSINIWEDRIIIDEIFVLVNENSHQYEVSLKYYIKETDEIQQVDYILKGS